MDKEILHSSTVVQQKKENVLLRFFAGDLPLWISFWVMGVGVYTVLNMVQIFVFSPEAFHLFGRTGFILFIWTDFFLLCLYFVIAQIGIWRSAGKYEGVYYVWAPPLAKLSAILGCIRGVPALVGLYVQIQKIVLII